MAKKVLVVDDEPDVLEFVEAVLKEDGYSILTAADGEEALSVIASEDPDIVLLDVQMPKKGGFEVFGELRKAEATAGIPIVMLTGVSGRTGLPFSAKDMKEFIGSEPEGYLEKPIDPDKLRETVKAILGA